MASTLALLRLSTGACVLLLALASCNPSRPAATQSASGGPASEQPQATDDSTVEAPEAEPEPEPGPEPAHSEGPAPQEEVQGLKTMLDDGSYLFIPYADDGLDYCSAVVVKVDGTRTPHRPPDARRKCSTVWAEQD